LKPYGAFLTGNNMARINMDFAEYSGVIGINGYGAIITVK